MVFINDTPMCIDIRPLLEKHLATAQAPVITFDQLDVFPIISGRYIIHLSTSHVPEGFLALTESICSDMKTVGCVIRTDFMLHVTLGRIRSFDFKLSDLKVVTGNVSLPSLTLTLSNVDYREFRGKTIYETQLKD